MSEWAYVRIQQWNVWKVQESGRVEDISNMQSMHNLKYLKECTNISDFEGREQCRIYTNIQAPPWLLQAFSCCCECVGQSPATFLIWKRQTPEKEPIFWILYSGVHAWKQLQPNVCEKGLRCWFNGSVCVSGVCSVPGLCWTPSTGLMANWASLWWPATSSTGLKGTVYLSIHPINSCKSVSVTKSFFLIRISTPFI